MVSDEAVKAAANAHTPQFPNMDPEIQKYALQQMRAALTAAAPYMQGAAREQALEEACGPLETLAAELRKSINSYHQAQASALLERAAAIRALSSPDHADAGKSVEAEAARTLLNGDQGKIYAACEGISRVYKFTEVLERIASEGAE